MPSTCHRQTPLFPPNHPCPRRHCVPSRRPFETLGATGLLRPVPVQFWGPLPAPGRLALSSLPNLTRLSGSPHGPHCSVCLLNTSGCLLRLALVPASLQVRTSRLWHHRDTMSAPKEACGRNGSSQPQTTPRWSERPITLQCPSASSVSVSTSATSSPQSLRKEHVSRNLGRCCPELRELRAHGPGTWTNLESSPAQQAQLL